MNDIPEKYNTIQKYDSLITSDISYIISTPLTLQ